MPTTDPLYPSFWMMIGALAAIACYCFVKAMFELRKVAAASRQARLIREQLVANPLQGPMQGDVLRCHNGEMYPVGFYGDAEANSIDQAEQDFLGAVLIDNRILLGDPVGALRPEHFADGLHGDIFAAILSQMVGSPKPATPVTIRAHFVEDVRMIARGGVSYLARLTATGDGLRNPEALAERIKTASYRRFVNSFAPKPIAPLTPEQHAVLDGIEGRNRKGQFVKGSHGNPNGRRGKAPSD